MEATLMKDETPTATPIADQAPAKPLLRGWLHLGFAPLMLITGVFLTALAPTQLGRIGCAVFTLAAVQLFGTSAAYHRGNWGAAALATFRRIDHSNIFVFIAGTYTPLSLVLLDGASRVTLLTVVWTIAVLGVLFRTLWLGAPRWLYTLMYLGMGWVAVGWLGQFWASGGPAVVILLIAGGLLYSVGAVAYATKRPRLSPKWFGFHEVFHACTVLAAVCHTIAIWLAVFSVA